MAKPGIKTSEGLFNLLLIIVAVIVLLAPLIVGNLPENHWIAQAVATIAAFAGTFGYTRERSKVKIAEAAGTTEESIEKALDIATKAKDLNAP
jgi:hypothetical protein